MSILIRNTFCLAVLSILLFSQSSAQYFQHVYGDAVAGANDTDRVDDGHQVFFNLNGYMVSGTGEGVGMGPDKYPALAVVDQNGLSPGPNTFRKYYTVMDAAGTTLRAGSCFSSEIHWGDYAIAGVASTGSAGQHVYFARLDGTGAVLNSNTYSIGSPYDFYVVRELIPDSTGDYVFLVGDVWDTNNSTNLIFAMKIRYDGVLMWSELYDLYPSNGYDDFAYDGLVTAWGVDFVIVGTTRNPNSAQSSGYIFILDATTGSPSTAAPHIVLFTDTVYESTFTSIIWMYYPIHTWKSAYVAGGHTGVYGNPTAFRIDQALNTGTGFGNTYTTPSTNFDSWTYDIQHRINWAGNHEYLMAAQTWAGYFGLSDIEVWKLDNSLNAVSQMAYGYPGWDEVRALDFGPANDGMVLFGSTDNVTGFNDLLITRPYFSGHLPPGCAWTTNSVNTSSNIVVDSMPLVNPIGDHFVNDSGSVAYYAPMSGAPICYARRVGGGSNAKMDANGFNDPSVELVGNPFDGYTLRISNETTTTRPLELQVTNLLGQVLYASTQPIGQGDYEVQLPLHHHQYAAGIYVVRWDFGGEQGARKVILED